jgi:hypothetical protein
MKLYSYIVTHDTGFSPNPFFGYCTLACCKPVIRRTAKQGDWVIGLTPKSDRNHIVYFMRVDEVIGLDKYWRDARFEQKKPNYEDIFALRCGDNAYEPGPCGKFQQLRSTHSNGENENAKTKERDLSTRKVLISDTFAYFGSKRKDLPFELQPLIVQRGHRCNFPDNVLAAFRSFTSSIPFGVYAAPRKWKPGDDSWKRAAGARLIAK